MYLKETAMMHREQYVIPEVQLNKVLMDAAVCSIALAVFGYFINYTFPLKAVALMALLLTAFIISRNIGSLTVSSPGHFFSIRLSVYCVIGFQMGIAGAIYYRGSLGMTVLPALFRNFVLLAACIGIIEELIFRGFIQGMLTKLHPGFAILFSSFAHASYKASLFISPAATYHYPIAAFYTVSFGAFILIGMLRYYSKSIIPAIIVHVVFDLLVYAEIFQVPWWVW